jgi:hypothetical protein
MDRRQEEFMQTLLGLLMLTALTPFVSSSQTKAENDVGNPYPIYSAVIETMFKGGKVTFDTQAPVKNLVIRLNTTAELAYGPIDEEWGQIRSRIPALKDDTITDFKRRRQHSVKLERRLNVSLPYTLIPPADFDAIFDNHRGSNASPDLWKTFYEKYPESGGYLMFSNVGYSKDRDQALVYFVHWCGYTCGTGHFILVNQSEGEWLVSSVAQIWIS